jgi:predicted acetyltransferase
MVGRMAFDLVIPDSEQRAALERLLQLSYAIPTIPWTKFFERVGHQRLRAVVQEGRVVGGLAAYELAQFFGGATVPLAGIAGVGVAPESRGRGLAKTMLLRTLEQLRETTPLAGLYASTTTLYRSCGFEQAGTVMYFSAPLASFPRGDRALACMALPPRTHEPLHATYAKRAREWTGHLDRTPAIWDRLVDPYADAAYTYVFGENPSAPDGYIVFLQKPSAESLHFQVVVRDVAMTTRAAAQRILGFLHDLRSLADVIVWRGCAADPLLTLLPEQMHTVKRHERWMLRILDVHRALAARGYPPLSAEVHLAVHDANFPVNAGRRIFTVEAGHGETREGGRGDVTIDVRGLAALYSGFATPYTLRAAGLLDGPDVALTTLATIFAGPEPWCADHY